MSPECIKSEKRSSICQNVALSGRESVIGTGTIYRAYLTESYKQYLEKKCGKRDHCQDEEDPLVT